MLLVVGVGVGVAVFILNVYGVHKFKFYGPVRCSQKDQ